MTTLPIFNRGGSEVGTYELDLAELAPHINKQLLHDVVVMYQANLRQGTKKTKSRGEVAGSTRIFKWNNCITVIARDLAREEL